MKYRVWFHKGSGTPYDKVYYIEVEADNPAEAEKHISSDHPDAYGVSAYPVEEES